MVPELISFFFFNKLVENDLKDSLHYRHLLVKWCKKDWLENQH